MARFRFALSPRWLLSHLFVLALVVTMVNLGFWQLRRLDERKDFNARVEARIDQPPVPLAELLASVPAGEREYRRVTVDGVWSDSQAYHGNRARDGVTGVHVLSVLDLDDGSSVLVNRGFLARATLLQGQEADWAPGATPIDGLVLGGRSGGTLVTSREGYDEVNRVDTGLLGAAFDADLGELYVQQLSSDADLPSPLDPPEQDNGPHLSYAVQWFIFATIGLGGYLLVLARLSSERSDGALPGADEQPTDGPAPSDAPDALGGRAGRPGTGATTPR